jgi:hypothetical protein
LRGYLLAPATGDYIFWIASFRGNAPAELWLSDDENPARKERIAWLVPPGGLKQGQGGGKGAALGLEADWQRSPNQKSSPLSLVQGRRYYLEVWQEGGDIGSLAVGWRLPGDATDAPPRMVDIQALCPFIEGGGR